ncbi:MAG: transglycosylase SLT domain-containing protein [Gemmatimonadota bacterium]|nr:transglycosylase SLT domain-containing protein [Gemmatimonadota bacterium]
MARALRTAGGYLFAIVTLLCVIAYTVTRMRPIYAGRASVADQLAARLPAAKPVLPILQAVTGKNPRRDSTTVAALVASPQFEADRRAFAADLVSTGRMSQARADSIAGFAVREGYIRGIPPALIFGLMLTENATFVSRATSNVGAIGLMQIYPKYWIKPLGKRFGTDLEDDETNIQYGVYIMQEYLKPKQGQAMSPEQIRKGLLRYNGCVRGTNTPRCHTYPNKIARYVERDAKALCGGKGFYECITRPFMTGLLGRDVEG